MEHQHAQAAPTRGWRRHTQTAAIVLLPLVLATACTIGETDVVAVDEDTADVAAAADAGAATAAVIDGPTVESAEFVIINGATPATTPASTSTSSSTSSSTSTSIAAAEPASATSPTASDPADETATTTTVVDQAATTDASETTITTAAPVDGLVEVVNESSDQAYSIYASTRSQYPASETQFWAVSMVDFGTPGGFTPDQRACLIREFLISPNGQQLVADDAAGNQAAWSDEDGRPVLIDTAVFDWFNVQEVCAL